MAGKTVFHISFIRRTEDERRTESIKRREKKQKTKHHRHATKKDWHI